MKTTTSASETIMSELSIEDVLGEQGSVLPQRSLMRHRRRNVNSTTQLNFGGGSNSNNTSQFNFGHGSNTNSTTQINFGGGSNSNSTTQVNF